MTELYDQDAGQPSYPAVDRRSAFRREADRGIIAEQRETIKLLEGRLAMREEAIRRQNIVLATLRSYARRLETGS